MPWMKFLSALLVGFLLPSISYLIAKQSVHLTPKVYHRDDVHTSLLIKTLFMITAVVGGILVFQSKELWSLMETFMSVLIISTIAYFDILTGRIPIAFLYIALCVGVIFSLHTNQWISPLLGGLINLLIGFVIQRFGRKYAIMRFGDTADKSAFGMGDVFAAGAMGILLGYPLSAYGLLLSLVINLVLALLRAVADRQPLLGINIRLGPGFLLATVVVLLFI